MAPELVDVEPEPVEVEPDLVEVEPDLVEVEPEPVEGVASASSATVFIAGFLFFRFCWSVYLLKQRLFLWKRSLSLPKAWLRQAQPPCPSRDFFVPSILLECLSVETKAIFVEAAPDTVEVEPDLVEVEPEPVEVEPEPVEGVASASSATVSIA